MTQVSDAYRRGRSFALWALAAILFLAFAIDDMNHGRWAEVGVNVLFLINSVSGAIGARNEEMRQQNGAASGPA